MSDQLRDPSLLDALETCLPSPFDGSLWRVTRTGRDPCQCARGGGRWDDTTFDVLYTSIAEQGAIAEMHFHLRRGQPVVPSKPIYRLHELSYRSDNVLDLSDADRLRMLGVDASGLRKLGYASHRLEYRCTQQIGEAANFLGFDALIVPNARAKTTNLVVLCEQGEARMRDPDHPGNPIDWSAWQ